jgi:sortase A
VVLVLGLACLGYVGYQFFGTNLTAQGAFKSEKSELRTKWQQQEPTPTPKKSSKGATPTTPDPDSIIPGDAIGLLRIPAFGAGYEIPILSGVELDVLSRGVGHYPTTAMPGQIGNFAIAGHRITHGQPFARLLELNRGDRVVVETRDAIFTYVIDEAPRDLTVKASATWVLDPVPGKEKAVPTQALMTLTTCQDLFHSPDRSIAYAHLASTTNKG